MGRGTITVFTVIWNPMKVGKPENWIDLSKTFLLQFHNTPVDSIHWQSKKQRNHITCVFDWLLEHNPFHHILFCRESKWFLQTIDTVNSKSSLQSCWRKGHELWITKFTHRFRKKKKKFSPNIKNNISTMTCLQWCLCGNSFNQHSISPLHLSVQFQTNISSWDAMFSELMRHCRHWLCQMYLGGFNPLPEASWPCALKTKNVRFFFEIPCSVNLCHSTVHGSKHVWGWQRQEHVKG